MVLRLKMPDLKAEAAGAGGCPYCGSIPYGHGHNRHRRVVDTYFREVHQRRFKCTGCGRTFQTRPEGLSKGAHRSDRVRALGVVLYVLGLSYGKAAAVVRGLVGRTCAATVYGDVQRAGARAEEFHQEGLGKVRVLGVDGTGQRMKGWNEGLVFAVDHERQLLIRVEVMEEADEGKIRKFLKGLCREYGVEVLITDEHRSYSHAVKLPHRLCQAHWKRSKVRRARALAERAKNRGWKKAACHLEELANLVKAHPGGSEEPLRELWMRYVKYKAPPRGKRWSFGYEIRLLMQDVLDAWGKVGPTNNTTERLIGLLLKIRSKLMRGFAKRENLKNFVYLSAYLWANRTNCQLTSLVS